MTQDEIIEMAREASFTNHSTFEKCLVCNSDSLLHFAKLVAAKALAQPEHDYRTRYDRGCYKCGSHYCPADCPEPLHLVPQQPR